MLTFLAALHEVLVRPKPPTADELERGLDALTDYLKPRDPLGLARMPGLPGRVVYTVYRIDEPLLKRVQGAHLRPAGYLNTNRKPKVGDMLVLDGPRFRLHQPDDFERRYAWYMGTPQVA